VSSKRDDSISGTLTLVLMSFDIVSQVNQHELALVDIVRMLIDYLANGSESSVQNQSTPPGESLAPPRVLH